jgi:hypothetical protein
MDQNEDIMYNKFTTGNMCADQENSDAQWKAMHLYSEISVSHGGEYEDENILGYNAVHSRRNRRTFQRCVLPPSSEQEGCHLHLPLNLTNLCQHQCTQRRKRNLMRTVNW